MAKRGLPGPMGPMGPMDLPVLTDQPALMVPTFLDLYRQDMKPLMGSSEVLHTRNGT